ncbi:MAG: Zn-dependent oligopeptidase [Acidobacteria bacterium]|nr:Zn-dependent oligopeptidase [Acidobacteriota bacterium]
MVNPLVRQTCEPLNFDQIVSEDVTQAVTQVLAKVASVREQMIQSAPDNKLLRLHGFDLLYQSISDLLSPLYLMAETHPMAQMREFSRAGVQKLLDLGNDLRLDQELYGTLDQFSQHAVTLVPIEMRLMAKILEDFRLEGMALPDPQREELRKLNQAITQQELLFSQNISEDASTLTVKRTELDGLPQWFVEQFSATDGDVTVPCQSTNFQMIMKHAANEDVRRRMYVAYLNRAREKNLPVLQTLLTLRHQKAQLLGYDQYADGQLVDKMAHDAATVHSFYEELRELVAAKAQADYQELLQFSGQDQIETWNRTYLAERLQESAYQLHEEETKPYFSLDDVLKGLFRLCFDLFGISFRRVGIPTWHQDVKVFELVEDEKILGRCYLDLFPRENKFTHAACFDVRTRRTDVIPEAALVCNFTPPTGDRPSLLTHGEVETLFHEFGHLLHQLLSTSPLAILAGTNVLHDFVEVPSQLMEHWAWDTQTLQSFAQHWQTGEVIPRELIERLQATRTFGSGIHVQQQLFYGAVDMAYHGAYSPNLDVSAVTERLQNEMTHFAYVPGTGFETCFGHLVGYAAGYYGYLWARVFADDLFSAFEQAGVRNRQMGMKLRQSILAQGNTAEPMQLMHHFLGRPPQKDAFRRYLGVA